jgi:hypothetical protein
MGITIDTNMCDNHGDLNSMKNNNKPAADIPFIVHFFPYGQGMFAIPLAGRYH